MEYLIKTKSIGGMTEEQFFNFCQENDTLKIERTENGEIVIMAPTGFDTENFNLDLATELKLWNRKYKLGYVVGNNAGFVLPNSAVRSPDAAIISNNRMTLVTKDERKKFVHVCPDFVIELLSESDHAKSLQDKMKEWIENGCSLAWMVNPQKRETWIYRKNGEVEIKPFTAILYGEDVLPDFQLNLTNIFTED
jgi:Uma2 family endonuclease